MIQWRTTRRTKKKKRSPGPTDLPHPSSAGEHSLLCGLDAAGSPYGSLPGSFSPRRSAVLPAGLSARQRAGGWRLSPGCEQTEAEGVVEVWGSVCEAPGPALLCYRGLRVAAVLPAFSPCFRGSFCRVRHEVLVLRRRRSFWTEGSTWRISARFISLFFCAVFFY